MPTAVINEYRIWIFGFTCCSCGSVGRCYFVSSAAQNRTNRNVRKTGVVSIQSIYSVQKYNKILFYNTATSSIPFTLFWLAPIGLCGHKRDYISLQGRRGPGTIYIYTYLQHISTGTRTAAAVKRSASFVLHAAGQEIQAYYYNNAVRSCGIYWRELTVILLM